MSRKALAPVNVPSASADPTLPTLRAGDVYVNSTSKALRAYDGTAWHEHDTLDLATTLSGAKTFTGGVIVNTTGITGNKEINLTGTGASSVGGTLQGTAVIAAGLTGSTAASRYVGATATGAPTTGAHLVGDWVVAQSGAIFICTVAGTPGTWVAAATNSPVSSVAGRTGVVVLTAADVGAGTFPGAVTFANNNNINFAQPAGNSGVIRGTPAGRVLIIGGPAGFAVNNNANSANLISFTDAGAANLLAGTLSTIPLTIKAAAAQSADLVNLTDSTNAVLSKLTADGSYTGPTVNATTDLQVGGASISRGWVGGATGQAATAAISTTETAAATGTIENVTFTAVTGRRYKITVTAPIKGSAAGADFLLRVRDGGGSAPVAGAGTVLDLKEWTAPGTTESLVEWTFYVTGLSAGAHHLGLFAIRASGTTTLVLGSATASHNSSMIIEDIGV